MGRLENPDRGCSQAPQSSKRSIGVVVFSFYKIFLGPTLHILGGAGFGCRYYPTCSEYCRQSFSSHSFFEALRLSFVRILRCNPWISRDYFDPVPVLAGKKLRKA